MVLKKEEHVTFENKIISQACCAYMKLQHIYDIFTLIYIDPYPKIFIYWL